MNLVFPRYVQFRTLTETYLCKVSKDKVVLTIYDLAQKCLCKIKAASSDPKALLGRLSRDPVSVFKELMKEKAGSFNLTSFDTSPPNLEECQTTLKKAIADLQSGMIVGHDHSEQFKCPITLAVFKEPLVCSCGHTFEKEAIERATKKKQICPIDKKPITSMAPNFAIKNALEEWQQPDSVLTFDSFQKENSSLSQANLTKAKAFMEERELSQALECYKKAFQYTKDPKEYAAIPDLYKALQKIEKARLSYLYLALYLIEAGDIAGALNSLEKAQALQLPPSLSLHSALITLARHAKDLVKPEKVKQLIQEATALLETAPPAKARVFGYLLLSQDVANTSLYKRMSALAGNENERKHLLFKGALHAFQAQKLSDAKHLCDQVAPTTFEDILAAFQIYPKRVDLLQEYAIKALSGKQFKSARQAFKILLSHEENPTYYERLIDTYFEEGKTFKVFSKAIHLTELLITQDSYAKAEEVCERALEASQNPHQTLQLYQKLEVAYLKTNSPKLEDLWVKLGQAYEETHDMIQAQKTYEKAQERFKTLFFSFKRAYLLAQKGDLQESLLIYYAQAEQAILNQNLEELESCYQEMLKADPQLRHLDGLQKIHLLSQRQILKLAHELKQTQTELARVSQRVEGLKRPAEIELEKTEAKRPQLEKLPQMCFGKDKWLQYFGLEVVEPPLPPDIDQILAGPCPIFPGKKVAETHLLTLIPEGMTLERLESLVQNPKQGNKIGFRRKEDSTWKEHSQTSSPKTHWALLTNDVIPGSKNQTWEAQKALAAKYSSQGYELPSVIDVAASLFLEYVQTGKRFYTDSPFTYTRCVELLWGKWPVVVGGFAPAGLLVYDESFLYCSSHDVDYVSDFVGVGAVRKSF